MSKYWILWYSCQYCWKIADAEEKTANFWSSNLPHVNQFMSNCIYQNKFLKITLYIGNLNIRQIDTIFSHLNVDNYSKNDCLALSKLYVIHAKFDHWGYKLAPLKSVTKYLFCVCAEKCCPSWELNPGPSTCRVDALPTELSGQLRIQCPQCPRVLLVSDGPSPLTGCWHQHTILFWATQCSTGEQVRCLLVIVFCVCNTLSSILNLRNNTNCTFEVYLFVISSLVHLASFK